MIPVVPVVMVAMAVPVTVPIMLPAAAPRGAAVVSAPISPVTPAMIVPVAIITGNAVVVAIAPAHKVPASWHPIPTGAGTLWAGAIATTTALPVIMATGTIIAGV